jgi:hypothetical protein
VSALARSVLLAVALVAADARAERGLFAVSAEVGPGFTGPTLLEADRGLVLTGACEYGVAERWSLALSLGGEFFQDAKTLSLSLGPHATLLENQWTTLQLFAVPELLPKWSAAGSQLDLGARAGVALRYQLLWGLGLSMQASVRARAEASGATPVRFEGLLVGGLFVEA